ncbi:FAD-binding protein [bacterium]|nr:FAD-binding protein [bacterium]
MVQSSLEKQLRGLMPRGRVLTAAAQLAGYDADGLGYKTFRPDAVVIPANVDELIAVLTASQSLGLPITMRGAGTSLSGGPVAAQGGIVVHTSALKSIRTICREGYWCEVECSVTLNQLDEALRPYGCFYPPDPSSGPVCTLGGNVAMNAGGAHCFRYGVTSHYVLGLEVVLLDGSVHRLGGPAGGRGDWQADWKRLMVGSEGTLGAFTRFWLRLLPRPEKAWTFRATFPDLASAERAIHALVAHPSFPVAIELMDPRCVAMVEQSPMAVGLPRDVFLIVTEIEGPAALVDARVDSVSELLTAAGAATVDYSDDETQRKKLWKARKVAGGLMGQLSPDFLVQDAVIPKRALAELLQLVYDEADAAGLRAVNVFHAGDGNLHPNFLFDSRNEQELHAVEAISQRLMQRVVDVGGTLSGEHGIGNDKTAYMPLVFGPDTLRLQLAVPAVFNPQHQLNPLKVFRSRRYQVQVHNNSDEASKSSHKFLNSNGAPRFTHFLDALDGIACVSAEATPAEIAALAGPHRLRFPLWLDDAAPLSQQIAAAEFAPASSRFGPFCDNITGMNWELPDGRLVRIGERVAKSTTGYDLLRFLLHSGESFGQARDYVMRLRPDCGNQSLAYLVGNLAEISAAVPRLLHSSWMNWCDACDVIVVPNSATTTLRISINAPASETDAYHGWLQELAVLTGLALTHEETDHVPRDGLPDAWWKTTPDRVVTLASKIAKRYGWTCIGLLYNGVVHGYAPGDVDRETFTSMQESFGSSLHELGGDLQSRHFPRNFPNPVEAQWLQILTREFAVQ